MSRPRFHISEAAPGARLVLPDHSAHHAREVLRLKPGAEVSVFDGSGQEFEAVLDEVSRRRVSLALGAPMKPRPESPLRLVLAVAPLRGDRMELVIQKATELGVSEVWPVVTHRTDAVARPALRGTRDRRWERVASGAAEQCGRATVPGMASTTTLAEMLQKPFPGLRAVLLETGGLPALATLEPPSALLLLVGPAGGFEPAEVEALRAADFRTVSLGPRILRSETAAVAAVALAQALWGDLGVR